RSWSGRSYPTRLLSKRGMTRTGRMSCTRWPRATTRTAGRELHPARRYPPPGAPTAHGLTDVRGLEREPLPEMTYGKQANHDRRRPIRPTPGQARQDAGTGGGGEYDG